MDLTAPMVNRLCMLDWEADDESFIAGIRNKQQFPAPKVPLVPDNFMDFYDQWAMVFCNFLGAYRDLLHRCPNPGATEEGEGVQLEGQPWPSRRSWTLGLRCLAAASSVNAHETTLSKIINGYVGEAAGAQFIAHWKSLVLPDPEALLSSPGGFNLPATSDLTIAVVNSVCNAIELDKTADRWEAGRDFFERLQSLGADEIVQAKLGRINKVKPESYQPRRRGGIWQEIESMRAEVEEALAGVNQ